MAAAADRIEARRSLEQLEVVYAAVAACMCEKGGKVKTKVRDAFKRIATNYG